MNIYYFNMLLFYFTNSIFSEFFNAFLLILLFPLWFFSPWKFGLGGGRWRLIINWSNRCYWWDHSKAFLRSTLCFFFFSFFFFFKGCPEVTLRSASSLLTEMRNRPDRGSAVHGFMCELFDSWSMLLLPVVTLATLTLFESDWCIYEGPGAASRVSMGFVGISLELLLFGRSLLRCRFGEDLRDLLDGWEKMHVFFPLSWRLEYLLLRRFDCSQLGSRKFISLINVLLIDKNKAKPSTLCVHTLKGLAGKFSILSIVKSSVECSLLTLFCYYKSLWKCASMYNDACRPLALASWHSLILYLFLCKILQSFPVIEWKHDPWFWPISSFQITERWWKRLLYSAAARVSKELSSLPRREMVS